MKKRLIFIILFAAFWFVYFVGIRLLFLVYNFELAKAFSAMEWITIFWHGLPMDISLIGYFLLLPTLFIGATVSFSGKWIYKSLKIYTFILLILCSLIVVADMELYKQWGYRMDTTPLMYLRNPKEAFASTPFITYLKQFVVFLVLVFASFWVYSRFVGSVIIENIKASLLYIPVFILLTGALILPIRGGIGVATMNIGSVYFHKKPFANHAAINEIWNLMYAFTEMNEQDKNPYTFFDLPFSSQKVHDLYPEDSMGGDGIFKIKKPNVILFIMESFSAKIMERLQGWEGVAPNMDKLSYEGIFFDNIYASGDRTDKGLAAVLSGYPSQPTSSIIKFPDKVEKLPMLPLKLEELGYSSTFFYGGDANFANMKSYLTVAGFESIIDLSSYPKNMRSSKWGAFDQYVFNNALKSATTEPNPFFFTILSLSSHDPFDVPHTSNFNGQDDFSKYLNSIHYTDSCLGDFVEKAKQSAWWDSTLIIIIADHGVKHPRENPMFHPSNFHIPMLWLGGALKENGITNKFIGNQTDIAKTILAQLNMDPSDFKFSKNLFQSNQKSFAWYTFKDGFGFVTDSTILTYENEQKSIIFWKGRNDTLAIKQGKAYLQVLFQDFVDK